jgi:hypothetical protein
MPSETFERFISDLNAWINMPDEEKDANEALAERMEDDLRRLNKSEAEASRQVSRIFTAWKELTANQRFFALRILCKTVYFSYAPRSAAELIKITTEEEKKNLREEQIEVLERGDDEALERANRRILDSMANRFPLRPPQLTPRPVRK